jgi:uncharacterized protein (DUF433 family)
METVLSIDLIASDPKVRRGRPVVAGTGVCVSDIVTVMQFHRQDADDLASWFDLSLAQIHAALAYYYANKDAIDREMQERHALAAEFKEKRVGNRNPILSG